MIAGMMGRTVLAACAIVIAVLTMASEAEDVFKDETITPAPGDYRMVELFLDGCEVKSWNMTGPEVFRASFRDGTARKVQRTNYAKYAAELAVTETSIKGPIVWRDEWAEYEVMVEGKIADGGIGGTWELTRRKDSTQPGSIGWSGPEKGTLRGTIVREAVLVKANALPSGKDWPRYYGPNNGSFWVPPSGVSLVTDPQAVRLAWRSEEFTAGGQGNANAYANQIEGSHAHGGGASPVLSADGKLYVNYFRPAGSEYSQASKDKNLGTPDMKWDGGHGRYYWQHLDRFKKQPDPDTMLKFLDRADDIVVCMDAATGKTLWKTIHGGKGKNWFAHKTGPVNNTPCLGDGRVYMMGSGGTLYATDAATGKPIWEVPKVGVLAMNGGQNMDRYSGNAPIFVDGVVVCGDQASTLYGFDAATGKELWKLPGKNNSLAVPPLWRHGAKSHIITQNGSSHVLATSIWCVEVKTGTVAWEAPYGGGIDGISVNGDIAVGTMGSVKNSYSSNYCAVAYRLTPARAEPLWTMSCSDWRWVPTLPPPMNDKFVVIGGETQDGKSKVMKMLDVQTGTELARLETPQDLSGWNEPVMILVEDRLVLVPDNSHGSHTLGFFGATPETFKHLFTWHPIHPTTTSYHCKPMMLPWVDGRIFIRGLDGIYSYDFRAKK